MTLVARTHGYREWVAPAPSAHDSGSADPPLAEASWLLDEWATVGSDPGYLAERSREVVARLRARLNELAAAQVQPERDANLQRQALPPGDLT